MIASTKWMRRSNVSCAMHRASCCRGYELPTDIQIIRPGERYYDDKGVEMWDTVDRLLAKLEAKSA